MKERIIAVPKNKDAQIALDKNEATKNQLMEIILSENEFNKLWENDIFKIINYSSNSNIDDYEDESITDADKIKNVIKTLKSKETFFHSNISNAVIEIRKLFEEALNRNTGVFFYF